MGTYFVAVADMSLLSDDAPNTPGVFGASAVVHIRTADEHRTARAPMGPAASRSQPHPVQTLFYSATWPVNVQVRFLVAARVCGHGGVHWWA
jgi:hypothetical protein